MKKGNCGPGLVCGTEQPNCPNQDKYLQGPVQIESFRSSLFDLQCSHLSQVMFCGLVDEHRVCLVSSVMVRSSLKFC